MRLWNDHKRCFRYHPSGHKTRDCNETDRSSCCKGCIKSGHYVKEFKGMEEERATFREEARPSTQWFDSCKSMFVYADWRRIS